MLILLLLSVLKPCFCSRPKTVFYWDVPPYIYEENGTIKGSMRHSIDMWERFCANPKSRFYKVKGGYKGFGEALQSVMKGQSFVDTDLGNITTRHDDAWLPLLNVSLKEEYKEIKQPYTFFVSKELVVMIPRYKIEILHKINLGVNRSLNFVVSCVALALVAGMIVWFLVSSTLLTYL